MIALWPLVVVSDNSLSRVAVEEPIFVVMSASFYRGWDAPDHHLQNRAVVEVHSVALKQFSLHVGNYANRLRVVNWKMIAECQKRMTPDRRMEIASSMFETARAIIEPSLPRDLTPRPPPCIR